MNTEELAANLVDWIRERVTGAGCSGVVLGMSGGLDSSVTAVLCRRAFPRTTLGVLMPCHSNGEDEEHACLVANHFAIPTRTIVLDGIYDSLLQILPAGDADGVANRLAPANIKPRLRMLTLYYLANRLGYMVVGSSNRSELAVGYFTKHGDSGVDILPIGGLVKKDVRELASSLGVPRPIIDKPPSAGLWPGQTDEDEMGLSYQEIDNYLTGGVTGNTIRDKIEAMFRASQHKRQTPPIADFEP